MSLRRFEDWPARLDVAIARARHIPFQWGRHDCCLFACDVVHALTGVDPGAEIRGRYESELGARRLLKSLYGGSLECAVRDHAGRYFGAATAPLAAGRGDCVLLRNGGQVCLGIVAGRVIAAPGPDELSLVPLDAAFAAWRV